MPVTYKIDPAKKLIRTNCIGHVTLEEVTDHFRDLGRDPTRPNRLNVFLDLSGVTSLPESQQVRAASTGVKELLRSVQFDACAIVASNDALFGMMRMFQVFASEYFVVTQVFRVAAEAEAWLASHESKSNPGK